MSVAQFPTPEPWPVETFADYGIADLEALIEGARAAIDERRSAAADAATCPDCSEIVHPSATSCEGCGTHLAPSKTTGPARDSLDERSAQGQEVTIVMEAHGCTCGGRGLCVRCTLQSYEPEIEAVNRAHDTLEAALARPANVTPLHRGHSMRVVDREPTDEEMTRGGPYLMDNRGENHWSL